jgi:hypothetical protein
MINFRIVDTNKINKMESFIHNLDPWLGGIDIYKITAVMKDI